MQFAIGAVTAPLVGVLGVDALAMAMVVAGSITLALLVLLAAVRPWSLTEEDLEHADELDALIAAH